MPQFVVIQPAKPKRGYGKKRRAKRGGCQNGDGFKDFVKKVENAANKTNKFLKKAGFARHAVDILEKTGAADSLRGNQQGKVGWDYLNKAAQSGYGSGTHRRRRIPQRGRGEIMVA